MQGCNDDYFQIPNRTVKYRFNMSDTSRNRVLKQNLAKIGTFGAGKEVKSFSVLELNVNGNSWETTIMVITVSVS